MDQLLTSVSTCKRYRYLCLPLIRIPTRNRIKENVIVYIFKEHPGECKLSHDDKQDTKRSKQKWRSKNTNVFQVLDKVRKA